MVLIYYLLKYRNQVFKSIYHHKNFKEKSFFIALLNIVKLIILFLLLFNQFKIIILKHYDPYFLNNR